MDEVDLSAQAGFSGLSKKERKKLKRELERQKREKQGKGGKLGYWAVGLLGIGLLLLGGWWGFQELTKPLPGQKVADQGRLHVSQSEWEKFSYNSNPPTSGSHDATWTKAGIYDTPQGDGHLIHALEHGYVVISYNCSQISKLKSQNLNLQLKTQNFFSVFAHETGEMHEEEMASASAEQTSSSAELRDDTWENEDCKTLKKQLADLADKNKLWKLIVVPRPNLDVAIALTAWVRIAKLDKFEEQGINSFIDSYRNRGPEATTE